MLQQCLDGRELVAPIIKSANLTALQQTLSAATTTTLRTRLVLSVSMRILVVAERLLSNT